MTLIQHAAYKSLTQSGIPVLLVNNDNDSLGVSIEKGFKKILGMGEWAPFFPMPIQAYPPSVSL